MNRKLSTWSSLGLVGLLGTLSTNAHAITRTWNNPAGGNWSVPTNWLPNGIPATGDDVVINLPGTYTVTYNVASTDLNSLVVGTAGGVGTQTLLKPSFVLNVAAPSFIRTTGVLTQVQNNIGGTGDLTVEGTFNYNGGSVLGSGALVVSTGGALVINGTNHTLGRNLTNNSLINWFGGTGNLALTPGTTITNNSTFLVNTGLPIIRTTGAGANPSIVNNGAFFKGGANNGFTTLTSVNLVNNATATLNAGTLSFNSTGVYSQNSGTTNLAGGNLASVAASPVQLAGGALIGSGTITGSLTNAGGSVSPGANGFGTISVTGNYSQSGSSSYDVQIGGTTAGTDYDVLNVGGSAALGGALNVSLVNGFDPSSGQVFQVLNYGSRTGTFSSINRVSGFSNTQSVSPRYNATNFQLVGADAAVSILSPVNGAFVNAPAVIRGKVNGNLEGGLTAVNITVVENQTGRYWNGTAFQATPTSFPAQVDSASGEFNAKNGPGTTAVTDGFTYTITAVGTTQAGTTITGDSVTVIVDKTRPTITVDNAPANSSVVQSLNDPITGTASDVSGNPSGSASGFREVRLTLRRQSDGLYWNGATFQAAATSIPATVTGNTYSVSPLPTPGSNPSTNLTDGIYTLVVASYDNASNNNGITRSFTVDSTVPAAPSFTLVGDKASPMNGDTVTSLSPIRGTASDATSGIARVDLQLVRNSDGFYWNGSAFTAAPATLTTGLSTATAGVTPWARNNGLPSASATQSGSYTITATAFDRAGLSTSNSVTVQVGSAAPPAPAGPPAPSFSQVGDNTNPMDGATVTSLQPIRGTASGEFSRVDLQLVRLSDGFYWNGSEFQAAPANLPTALSIPSNGGTPWAREFGLPPATPGSYKITAIAVDSANRSTPKSVTVQVPGAAAAVRARRSLSPSAGNS